MICSQYQPTSQNTAWDFYAARDTLLINEVLGPNDQLTSSNGWYTIKMQDDGNLVTFDNHLQFPVWSTGSEGPFKSFACLEEDGNFVVRRYTGSVSTTASSMPEWQTGAAAGATRITLKNNGTLVMYNDAGVTVYTACERWLVFPSLVGHLDAVYTCA